VEVVSEQLLDVENAVSSAVLVHDGDAVPHCECGDKAPVVTGNVLFDETLVMFGQVMVVEKVVLVQGVEIELAEATVVETMVFVLVPDSDALLCEKLPVQNFL
jgi:hypothetical protein